MRTSQTFASILKALLLSTEQIGPIEKEGWNPDTKSKYASFNLIHAKVKPVLHANGVLVVQDISPESPPGYMDVLTTFVHVASSEWMETRVRLAIVGRRSSKAEGGYYPPDPQSSGSAFTYGKRYGLVSALFLVADEDDDGQGAKPSTAKAVDKARQQANVGQQGQALVEGIMPVGGPTQRGKPIADMGLPVLRAALQHCRQNGKKNEARIIAKELTRRALDGDKKAEAQLREAAREDDTVSEVAEEARQARDDQMAGTEGA